MAGASNHLETKVASGNGVQARPSLTVAGTNSKFILNPGAYIVGRRSSDSKATLQLAPDISMSRQHARLVVQVVAGKPMAQIMGLKASNPILVNGKICATGRPCTLKPGDIIQLGMTKIVFTI
ncbi:MAG: FHA domain-containing protein [Muribaculaceae bacterium]